MEKQAEIRSKENAIPKPKLAMYTEIKVRAPFPNQN